MKVAVIGGGVIGGGWVARFLLNGHDVTVFDPAPDAEPKLGAVLGNARASLPALYDRPPPAEGALRFAADSVEAVAGADWVQEGAPERLEVKRDLYAQIEPHLGHGTVRASSTSGYKPSHLQALLHRVERLIVTHPFNPVYLVPLVEVVGAGRTPEALKTRAAETLSDIGMHPLVMQAEVDGFEWPHE